jgi:hypothetical protein
MDREQHRHSGGFGEDGYRHLDESAEVSVGVYIPTRRLMGVVAASAAAGEFLRRIAQIGSGDRPDPPPRDNKDEPETLDEDIVTKVA